LEIHLVSQLVFLNKKKKKERREKKRKEKKGKEKSSFFTKGGWVMKAEEPEVLVNVAGSLLSLFYIL